MKVNLIDSTIYILKAKRHGDNFEFSLGAYLSHIKALNALRIQNEVSGHIYKHWIDEETILDLPKIEE